MMRALLVLMILLACGCGGLVPMTEIAIDPNLTADEQLAVLDAAEAWFGAVPYARVPVRVGEDRGRGYVTRDPCAGAIALGATLLHAYGVAPRVYFCAQLNPADARNIMLHELGHALAYRDDHLLGPDVMASSPGSVNLTAADVAYLAETISR